MTVMQGKASRENHFFFFLQFGLYSSFNVFFLNYQTRCIQGCSINTFVVNSLIDSLSLPFVQSVHENVYPKP